MQLAEMPAYTDLYGDHKNETIGYRNVKSQKKVVS